MAILHVQIVKSSYFNNSNHGIYYLDLRAVKVILRLMNETFIIMIIFPVQIVKSSYFNNSNHGIYYLDLRAEKVILRLIP